MTGRPFTTEEIERLWELVKEHEWIDTILIMITQDLEQENYWKLKQ